MTWFDRKDTPRIRAIGATDRWWPDQRAWLAHGHTWVRSAAGGVCVLPFEARRVSCSLVDERWVVGASATDLGAVVRAGHDLRIVRTRPDGWTAPFSLPRTARRSPTTRPFPFGVGVAWQADGLVCTATPAGRYARATWDGEWDVGPYGALALGDGARWTHIGGPGKTPLPCEPFEFIAWNSDGTRAPCPAPSAATPAAAWGPHLVGPGAQVWNLETGEHRPLVGTPQLVGAGPLGYLLVDRDGVAWHDWLGGLVSRVTLPLVVPDGLDRVQGAPDGFLLWSALGVAWHLTAQGPRRTTTPRPRRPRARRSARHGLTLRIAGDVVHGSSRWTWTPCGLLLQSSASSYVR